MHLVPGALRKFKIAYLGGGKPVGAPVFPLWLCQKQGWTDLLFTRDILLDVETEAEAPHKCHSEWLFLGLGSIQECDTEQSSCRGNLSSTLFWLCLVTSDLFIQNKFLSCILHYWNVCLFLTWFVSEASSYLPPSQLSLHLCC